MRHEDEDEYEDATEAEVEVECVKFKMCHVQEQLFGLFVKFTKATAYKQTEYYAIPFVRSFICSERSFFSSVVRLFIRSLVT